MKGEGIVSAPRKRGNRQRCRLTASWGGSTSQGSVCSPVKAVRELGSERRKTVRSLSSRGEGFLRGTDPSKNLLLREVIRDDNTANNGGILSKLWYVDNYYCTRSVNGSTLT